MPALKIIRSGSFHPWLGVFETLCVRGGRPILLEEHWQSLCRACAELGLKRPCDFRPMTRELPKADGRWRWIVDSDGSSHSFQRERPARHVGLSLIPARVRVGSANLDARYKTLSYLAHWQARQENPKGEALLLNEHGQITSGARSNLFWVRGRRVFTPAEECGCRAGVVRGWVLGESRVKLARSRITALNHADEIFVTNSMLGICAVTRWRNRRLRIGPVTRMLREQYERMVREG